MVNVLIVDDERAIRKFFSRALTEIGHNVVTAENGREGLDKLLQGLVQGPRPDIIFSDFEMPEYDGGRFVTAIATDTTYEMYKDVPVIGIGSFPDGHLYLRDRLHKPFVANEIQQMIEKYCQKL